MCEQSARKSRVAHGEKNAQPGISDWGACVTWDKRAACAATPSYASFSPCVAWDFQLRPIRDLGFPTVTHARLGISSYEPCVSQDFQPWPMRNLGFLATVTTQRAVLGMSARSVAAPRARNHAQPRIRGRGPMRSSGFCGRGAHVQLGMCALPELRVQKMEPSNA